VEKTRTYNIDHVFFKEIPSTTTTTATTITTAATITTY
jgi:hypothetical protein